MTATSLPRRTTLRAPRGGLLDFLLLVPLAYALYAKTPLGAIGETAVRVARGQADRPDWLSTFRGRETDVAYAATPQPPQPPTTVATPLQKALAGKDDTVRVVVQALFAAHGSCSNVSCALTPPAAAGEVWPAIAGRTGLTADGAVSLVERARKRWGPRGVRTPELIVESLSIGVDTTARAVAQAERSGADDPWDVEAHAAYLPPSVRRGALQEALVVIADVRMRSLAWPAAEHFRVTSPFGDRIHPVTGENKFHNGTDIGVPVGTPLVAAYRGRVDRNSTDSISGTYLVLRYGLGLESVLCHLSETKVAARDLVDKEQQVARSGNSGRVTGPHLHYILRVNGKPVDAELYRPPTPSDAPRDAQPTAP